MEKGNDSSVVANMYATKSTSVFSRSINPENRCVFIVIDGESGVLVIVMR